MELAQKEKVLRQDVVWESALEAKNQGTRTKMSHEEVKGLATVVEGVLVPRPRRFRRIMSDPDVTYFKPVGVRMRFLETVTLEMEEFEAIRLKDSLKKDQIECAKEMNISQPTFNRILLVAREKIADAIINGKAIKINKSTKN